MTKEKTTVSGMGFCGWLTITFIALKLCNVITWPWVWVLAPLWIPIVLGVSIVLAAVIGFAVFTLVFGKSRWR